MAIQSRNRTAEVLKHALDGILDHCGWSQYQKESISEFSILKLLRLSRLCTSSLGRTSPLPGRNCQSVNIQRHVWMPHLRCTVVQNDALYEMQKMEKWEEMGEMGGNGGKWG